MRASRLLNMLLLLQARGRMTARQLAGELEVSVRTVYRDVQSLHAAGIALYGADFDARRHRDRAVVRLSPDAVRRLPDLLDAVVVRAVEATAEAPDAAGWVRAVIPIESVEHAASELLRLGADAEVLEPPALRERLAATVAALAHTYLG